MVKTDLNTRASYKLYKEGNKTAVDIKIYMKICNLYMKYLFEKVLEGFEVPLPAKLGTLSIVGKKKKIAYTEDGKVKLPPDWKKTKELWENNPGAKEQGRMVYHTNEDTNGVVYHIHWSKNKVPIENKSFYTLRFTRKNKRNSSKIIKQGKEFLIKNI